MRRLDAVQWGMFIFLMAVVGFGLFVISYTWGVSGRFPLVQPIGKFSFHSFTLIQIPEYVISNIGSWY